MLMRLSIPKGEAGTKKTLYWMGILAKDGSRCIEVIKKTREIIKNIPEAKKFKEMKEVFYWVKNNIRYVKDPVEAEYLQHPKRTLEIKQGDCDDISTLLASMLLSIGIPVRFVAVKTLDKPYFSHVFVEADPYNRGEWIILDATYKRGRLGETMPHRGIRLIQELFRKQ